MRENGNISLVAILNFILIAAVAAVCPTAVRVETNGTVMTENLTASEVRLPDGFVLAPHARRIDYRKKSGRPNSYDAGLGDREPWKVSEADRSRFAELGRRTFAVRPVRPRRVLVVARALGFPHTEALVWGSAAIKAAAEASGLAVVDVTEDVSVLSRAEDLRLYDAVVLNNTTSLSRKGNPKLAATVKAFVEAGGGLFFLHSAVDAFYDDGDMQLLSGGLFAGHPWLFDGCWAVRNERPDDPTLATFPHGVSRYSDEIYMQKSPPFDRAKCEVLLSLDLDDPATAKAESDWGASDRAKKLPLRGDRDYAVSWKKAVGRGRIFYTSFGHDARAFFDPVRFGHILLGLAYCLGPCPAKGNR